MRENEERFFRFISTVGKEKKLLTLFYRIPSIMHDSTSDLNSGCRGCRCQHIYSRGIWVEQYDTWDEILDVIRRDGYFDEARCWAEDGTFAPFRAMTCPILSIVS